MPALQVRDMPDTLYRKLVEKARREHRSLAQQAVIELASSLNVELNPRQRRKSILDALTRLRGDLDASFLPDPVELIREDRDR